jgi:hypothetical protein
MKYTLTVEYDDCGFNPRTDFDNLGTMVFEPSRHGIEGDKHNYKFGNSERTMTREQAMAKVEREIIKNENPAIILPVYAYVHGSVTISTTPFSCPWDSFQAGFIFIPKDNLKEEYKVKKISKKLKEAMTGRLVSEVKTYDDYLKGDRFSYVIKDEDGNVVDSCGGFLGGEDYCRRKGESALKYLEDQERKKRQNKVKAYVKNRVPLEARVCG